MALDRGWSILRPAGQNPAREESLCGPRGDKSYFVFLGWHGQFLRIRKYFKKHIDSNKIIFIKPGNRRKSVFPIHCLKEFILKDRTAKSLRYWAKANKCSKNESGSPLYLFCLVPVDTAPGGLYWIN